MKILLVRFQILLIILFVFSPLIYLGYQKFAPQINLIKYDYEQRSNQHDSLPKLHTEGTKIVDEQGNPIILRGINLISTNWGEKYDNWNPMAIELAAKEWKVNVVRTRLYQHEFEINPSQFFLTLEKKILAPARANGLYVILHPWFGENQSVPDSTGIKMWLTTAKRYKNDPHIIYDLLAEPRDITFDELESTYRSLIPQIRAIAPDSIVMVTGLDWGRDINAWLQSPLPYDNIVYRSNPYNRTVEFPGYFGQIALKYPVFLGEFGTEDQLSMSEQDVKNLLGYADALDLGWTAWHFTASGCPCLLSDEESFAPNSYGQLVKSNLSGTKLPFTLPTFDTEPNKLYVYSDFLESGFADYSWGINNQFGPTITTNFHRSAGLFFNTSRRINPDEYQTFHFTFQSDEPEHFSLRFKSWDNQLSNSITLKDGQNVIPNSQINLESISGVMIEIAENAPDPLAITLDQIYFQK